jgi:hypothetical protein
VSQDSEEPLDTFSEDKEVSLADYIEGTGIELNDLIWGYPERKEAFLGYLSDEPR